jgi:integrase/recombinase XerD
MKITYKFYQRTDSDKNKSYPIYLQITLNRKTTKRAIGYSCKESEWKSETGTARYNHAINTKINSLTQNITDLQYKIEKDGANYTLAEVADIVFGVVSLTVTICDFFKSYKESALEVKRISKDTAKHYDTCRAALEEFIFNKYGPKDINIKKIDYAFIEEFDRFLHKKGIGLNTINGNYHKKLKTVFLYAEKQDLITSNPYAKFKMKFTPTHRDFLTNEELEKLKSFNLENHSFEKVRDIFLFSCYTGLRFSDALDLSMEQIRSNENTSFIYREQIKTGESINIPLVPEAMQIIEKYIDNENRVVKNKVLPHISNQNFNLYLKSIAGIVGLNKKLTHHVARHTFATFLLNKSVSLEVVSSLLGHTNIRTTQVYAKMQNKTVEDQVLKAFANNPKLTK